MLVSTVVFIVVVIVSFIVVFAFAVIVANELRVIVVVMIALCPVHVPLLPPLLLLPLAVVVSRAARAENCESAVPVAARALDYQVAVPVRGAALVDGVVIATLPNLVPSTIHATVDVVTDGVIRATEDDVSDAVGGSAVGAIRIAIVDVRHGLRADYAHAAIRVPACTLNDDVAVTVLRTALVNRVPAAIATDHTPRPIDIDAGGRGGKPTTQDLGIERRGRS
jgi:hypothetical protein